jgi:hypothetical protein
MFALKKWAIKKLTRTGNLFFGRVRRLLTEGTVWLVGESHAPKEAWRAWVD